MPRILIVDDERSIRNTLAEFIREDGYEVFTAEDATQALELLKEKQPPVVVTDIILPRMTGVKLLKRINEISPDTQVVMITGEPTAETAAEAVRLGAFDYLSKPIARTDFKSTVASALRVSELAIERRRLEKENQRYQEHLEEEVEKKTAALRTSEEKYRAVVDNAVEAVFVIQDGVIPFANPSTNLLSGRSTEELRTHPFIEWVHRDDRSFVADQHARRLRGEDPPEYEFRIIRPDGAITVGEIKGVQITWEGKPATLAFIHDITERKLRETKEAKRREILQERDAVLVQLAIDSALYQGSMSIAMQSITEISAQTLQIERVSIWLYTEDGRALECIDLYELSKRRHASGRSMQAADFPEYFRAIAAELVVAASDAHQDPRTSAFLEGYLAPLGISSMLDASIRVEGELVGVICHAQVGDQRSWEQEDINFAGSIANIVSLSLEAVNRRQAEKEKEQSETLYRNLFEGSPVSLWQENYSHTKALLEEIKARSLDKGIDDLETYLCAHPDDVAECIRRIQITDVNQASLALHKATSKEDLINSLTTVIVPEQRAKFIPQLVAIANGSTYFEGSSIDRTLDGREMHVDIRWIAVPGYEESLSMALVSKIDVTATIEAKEALEQALDGTIKAIGMTTETRDPYTAGHQRRVTELAVAIAEKLQFDPAVIEGTRVAGLMHDIGKLAIPAEILSKPSALNAMEFSLIQSHPQAAYDILETIVFPWPIADIVLQHHERIDGSGYPNGLSKDAIRVEARILAVADTVEAMASHRPYRPAMGIEPALEEIQANRGTKFDPDIVDACVELFRDGGFAFSSREA